MTNTGGTVIGTASPTTDQWLELAETQARAVCRAQHGGQSVSNVVLKRGHNQDQGHSLTSHANYTGKYLGWFYYDPTAPGYPYSSRARQSRTWTATCKKAIRRTRK